MVLKYVYLFVDIKNMLLNLKVHTDIRVCNVMFCVWLNEVVKYYYTILG